MKLLYDTVTATLKAYPRWDDEDVEGLDPRYLVMALTQQPRPPYNVATERLEPTEVVDVPARTVTRDWTIVPLPPIPPAPPDYAGVEDALMSTASVMTVNKNRMAPTVTLSTPTTLAELKTAVNNLAAANQLSYEWGRFSGLLSVLAATRGGDNNKPALIARFQARLLNWIDAGNFGAPARTTVQSLLDQYLPTRNYTVT